MMTTTEAAATSSSTLPPLVFGAGVFSGRYENGFDVESPDETAYAAVRQAYDLGIRCFDTSPYYNDSERVLGRALARLRRETAIQRSDYMTITKTGRYGPCKPDFDFTAARTRQSVATSIARLYGDDSDASSSSSNSSSNSNNISNNSSNSNEDIPQGRYLDAVLCHDVEFEDDPNVIVNGALTELFKLKSEGFVKRVGISGYPLNVLLDIAQRCQSRGHPLDLVLSYCNHNLHSRLLADYLPQLRQAGVKTILNASPLSMGLLRPSGPPSWHPANIELRSAVNRVVTEALQTNVDICKVAAQFTMRNLLCDGLVFGLCRQDEVLKAHEWMEEATSSEWTPSPKEQALLDFAEAELSPFYRYAWPSP